MSNDVVGSESGVLWTVDFGVKITDGWESPDPLNVDWIDSSYGLTCKLVIS